MSKRFRTCDLDQPYLLPPSLQDWLPENHLARFIVDVTNELDLRALYAAYERKDGRGLAAYHPLMMTRLLLYGYCTGVTSSRAIEKATYEQVPFRYLAADQHPDHDTVAAFRQDHLETLSGLFVQALRLCQKAGMVKLGKVAIDGTKMLANASTRRSVPAQKLNEREQHWQQVVDRLLAEAQATDADENERLDDDTDEGVPAQLADARQRLARIRQAKAELQEEAQRLLDEARARAGNLTPRRCGRPRKDEVSGVAQDTRERELQKTLLRKLRRAEKNARQPGRQYNFVDPDSRVMIDGARKCFVQAYNAQLAVDAEQQVIVAAEVTQQVTDDLQLVPMVGSICQTAGAKPEHVIADAGYWDTTNIRNPLLAEINVLVSPERRLSPDADAPGRHCRNAEAERMRKNLRSPEGEALYGLRKVVVEPVFGQIKDARGIRRFRLRGLTKVSCEWKLICATHNLLKLFRCRFPARSNPGARSPRQSEHKCVDPACIDGRSYRCRLHDGRSPQRSPRLRTSFAPVSLRQAPGVNGFSHPERG